LHLIHSIAANNQPAQATCVGAEQCVAHAVFGQSIGFERDCGKRQPFVERHFVCRAPLAALLEVRQRFVSGGSGLVFVRLFHGSLCVVNAPSSQYESTAAALWPAPGAAKSRRSTAQRGQVRGVWPLAMRYEWLQAPSLGTLLAAINASEITPSCDATPGGCGQSSCGAQRVRADSLRCCHDA
jgi:hypothetical protein